MKHLRSFGWLAFVSAVAIIGSITWFVVGQLVKRDIAWWGLALTLVVIIAATLSDWATRESKDNAKGWARFKSPNWLARLGMSSFFGLSTGLFVQQFVAPTDFDLTQRVLGTIRSDLRQLNSKADTIIAQTAPRPWRAFDNIDGLWGEQGQSCRVAYRFGRRDHGLTIVLERRQPGMRDYSMTASIAPDGRGDILRATLRSSTEPDEVSGQALIFSYTNDGVLEQLEWLNETRSADGPLKLERCS